MADQQAVQVAKPLEVEFSQEVARGYEAQISPDIGGEWQDQKTLFGTAGTTFVPKKRFEAGKTYKLRITGLKRLGTGAEIPDVEQTFTAQMPPTITAVTPADKDKDVAAKPQIKVELREPNHGVRALIPSLTPAAPLKLVSSDDKTFVWEPEAPLKQGVTYIFALNDDFMPKDKQLLISVGFTTVTQPVITSARSGGHFAPGQVIDINFDQPMTPAGEEAFTFGVKGKGSWVNEKLYRFTPEAVAPGKTYGYVVKAGLTSKAGGVIEGDRRYEFSTNGVVTASMSPGGTVRVNTPLRVNFDQPVDHNSAQSRFTVSPQVDGSFSWSGNTMIYTPKGEGYSTTYRFAVAPGVAPAWGLPSTGTLSWSYVTENQITILNVPAYKQAYGRSCELASLRILLAYRGIKVTDWDILMRIGYNPRARDTGSNSWENPNQTFVGFVNTFSWSQGYGVHSGPVAAAGRSFGRNTQNYFGVSAQFIAQQIRDGNPVEFYGHIGPPKADSWNTTSGVVATTTSMHARVAYGVAGPAENPTLFYIHDPWDNTRFTWTPAQLMANMNTIPGVSNQAVVVF